MFFKRNNNIGTFSKLSQKFFKNKVNVSGANLEMQKFPNLLRINVLSGGELNLENKAFFFGKNFFKNKITEVNFFLLKIN